MELYKDKSITVEQRLNDLLGRMTLKEKVGQLNQRIFGWNAFRKTADGFELTEHFMDEVAFGDGMGALYGLFRADPWSKVTYENGINAANSAKVANMIQRYCMEHTRLGIPVLLSEECPHGHQALDGTLTPTNIGIGSTWNPALAQEAYARVGAEIRARGGHLGLVSTLDLLRDPRWGRSEECYGEDPYLTAQFTASAVKGLQGSSTEALRHPDKVAAVLKHFSAQGSCEGGRNAAPASIGERELREIHLSGMEAGVEAGAMGCMAAYNEIDGIPCHANRKLLTGILRDEWNFQGIVMADGTAIDRLLLQAGDYESAAAMALRAGVDLSLWDTSFSTLERAVLNGKVEMSYINQAVSRVLRLKFELGLFDNPFTDEVAAIDVIGSDVTRKVNLQLARESAVLLKNEGKLLPLDSNVKQIAVIGPNADQIYNQLGDYTATQRPGHGVTVLEGIRKAAGSAQVAYAKGCGIRDMSRESFAEAVNVAKQSDVAILVMGGSSTRNFDIQFDINGAAIVTDGKPSEMDCGEGVDVTDLRLGGSQQELIREIAATGTPIVLVLIQGRPHAISEVVDQCSAVLCGWYPGPEGGQAIGEILFGKVNPSGKLTVTIPYSSAHLPVYYNHKDLGHEPRYADSVQISSYPFGYGESYTSFSYHNLHTVQPQYSIRDLEEGGYAEILIDVENVGPVAGAEVVQLYIKDMEASITTRVKELKGFQKIWLASGEKRTVRFRLTRKELGIWAADMNYAIEPGSVMVMVGGSSEDTKSVRIHLVS
ncbi:glycoside hydrolase family 3 N-terminal domain-containing protein [Paenibacillus sp. OSY-SE]|uniref:glycoside hydrolase family 3 N-terminal domain-containing protein n=1 Tax=Paenibacillus sp. OSY-SE TaxID=1196323 RepID=UPI000367164B|nr:glycoside hydrolase family 3 N-terminal domain-containing protein [Paenibacillus sp. OSY-SE]